MLYEVITQHVHLVDHVNLVARPGRCVLRRIEQLPHLVHPGVGRGIDFEQIDEATGIDLGAGTALAAGLRGHAQLAIETLGEDARQGRLADAARAREQISYNFV